MGVEFYRDISEVPVEWTVDADLAEVWSRSYSLTFGYAGLCGGDRYTIGSTAVLDASQAVKEDEAFACGHPQKQGYAAQQYATSMGGAPSIEMPKCGFVRVLDETVMVSHPKGIAFAAIVATLAMSALAGSLRAQVISGTVRDRVTRAVLPGSQ